MAFTDGVPRFPPRKNADTDTLHFQVDLPEWKEHSACVMSENWMAVVCNAQYISSQ